MADNIINSFDVWIRAQGLKSKGRLRSIDNISLEGIARLRELILELAISGKLVSQDPSDEPAITLLNKMAKEEEKLVKEKVIKKPKELPPISNDEFPFELPKGWEFTRLNNVGEWGAGATPLRGKHEYYGGNIPWFKSGELSSDFISQSEETVTELALKETSLRYNKIGDVLIAMYGATIGKASILKVPATTNQAVCACTPFAGIYNVFLLLLLKAYNKRFNDMGAGGAQPNISREKIIATVIPLPPMNEQHRIVAKVDELMALCDELERQETHHLKLHQLLVETLLGTLTQAKDATEFQAAWSRLAEHFDDIFVTEESIDQLKRTILQLAVTGKLVPQDPNDEPASELLKRIEKERLVKNGKVRGEKELPKINIAEIPFPKPRGWEFARLGQITNKIGSGSTPRGGKEAYVNQGILFLRSQNVWNNGLDLSDVAYITEETHESMSNTKVIANDILLNITGGSLGRSTIVPERLGEANVSQHVTIIRPTDIETRFFLHLCLLSPYGQNLIWGRQVGANREGLSKKVLELFEIPVPPVTEQQRIVKKIDEVFALCDRLKERMAEAKQIANKIADSIMEQIV